MIENKDTRLKEKELNEFARRHGRRVRHEGKVPFIPATASEAPFVAQKLQRGNPSENLPSPDDSV